VIISVFLGPSMPEDEARALLPDAVFHPPAQQGDLLACVNQGNATVIGLIDGTFHQNLSVWHNEVCYLLSRGITIYGASSMGALRAAETYPYGMVGVGEIFRWYRDGVISGDDEVALLHGDAASGFQPLSLPLVNIRASVRAAIAGGQLDAAAGAKLIEIAQSIYYPRRDLGVILERCREAGYSSPALMAAERALSQLYVDLKKQDAGELLAALRRLQDGIEPLPTPMAFEFARSSVFENLYNLDQKIETTEGAVTLQQVTEHFALQSIDFEEVRRASLDRSIVLFFAHILGIEVTPAEVTAERHAFMKQHGINSPEDLALWLKRNLFTETDLDEYLTQEANCRRMRAWVRSNGSLDRGAKALADELRMRDLLPGWALAAAEQAAIVHAYQDQPEYQDIANEDPRRLAQRHAAFTNVWIEGDAGAWAANAGFEEVEDLIVALRHSVIAHDVRARIAHQMAAIEPIETESDTSISLG
jgi:hypothetical protein